MIDKLLPCPFCGNEEPKFCSENEFREQEISDPDFVCFCGVCGSFGPSQTTSEEAITAWNTRKVNLNISVEKLAEVLVKLDDEATLGYCKSDCAEADGCPHPVECCIKWLRGE